MLRVLVAFSMTLACLGCESADLGDSQVEEFSHVVTEPGVAAVDERTQDGGATPGVEVNDPPTPRSDRGSDESPKEDESRPSRTGARGEPSVREPEPQAPITFGAFGDPFAPLDDVSMGLTNTGWTLEEILEHGELEGACERYAQDPTDTLEKMMCGKSMFFYETFGTAGLPVQAVDFLLEHFQEEVGPGFSNYGLFEDPYSEHGYPLGLALDEGATKLAFTCASCHLGRLNDGRYSVGAPNLDYEYGTHNLSLLALPLALMSDLGMAELHPDAVAKVAPVIDKLNSNWWLKGQFAWAAMDLVGAEVPPFPPEVQAQYAKWKSGTMDFVITPLPIDDGVETISKIPGIWAIPTEAEMNKAGMVHAMLGATGLTQSLAGFGELFVEFGGGPTEAWGEEALEPLVAYIESLRPPKPPTQDEALVEAGESVFLEAGCIDCHQGPRGSGLDLFTFEEIGTDAQMAKWMDPELDGEPCCGIDLSEHPVTNALKSPRLLGLWSMDRFLHNGAIESLDELLCLGPPAPVIEDPAFGNQGHTFGCDLPVADKQALISYLEAH